MIRLAFLIGATLGSLVVTVFLLGAFWLSMVMAVRQTIARWRERRVTLPEDMRETEEWAASRPMAAVRRGTR